MSDDTNTGIRISFSTPADTTPCEIRYTRQEQTFSVLFPCPACGSMDVRLTWNGGVCADCGAKQ